MFGLDDRVAVLTGAGGFLVGEIAIALSAAGARVALLDCNLEAAERVATQIRSLGGDPLVLEMDVTDKGHWTRCRDDVVDRLGPPDILLNGAGTNAPTPFLDIDPEEWHRILDVHLTGTMLGCQVVGASMVAQGHGVVINVSSASAGPPLSRAFTYSVAKAGIKNLTQNLAREWATAGVRVNVLRPGFFPTEWSKANFLSPERVDAILTHTPMRRFGEPRELVGAVLWLCSPSASFVTGAEIPVDGGFSAMTI